MRIYFSGSITGGKQFKQIQKEIVGYLESLGHEVVSRQHAQQETSEVDDGIKATDVFERNMWWLVHKSEAVVAEVSTPSLGVGMELGVAGVMALPTLALANESVADVSAMMVGNTNPGFLFKQYTDGSWRLEIDNWLKTMEEQLEADEISLYRLKHSDIVDSEQLDLGITERARTGQVSKQGLYIAFEGLNSVGKGTQVTKLEERLKQAGIEVWVCSEPGTTWLGKELRRLLQMQDTDVPVTRAEVAMLMAQRAQLVAKEIVPRLQQGVTVISDRSEGTSLAFQGSGRGQGLVRIAALNGYAVNGLRPDVVIYLRSNRDVLQNRKKDGEKLDRFEGEGSNFEELCYRGYEEAVRLDGLTPPKRWEVVDASRSIDQVHEGIWSIVGGKIVK